MCLLLVFFYIYMYLYFVVLFMNPAIIFLLNIPLHVFQVFIVDIKIYIGLVYVIYWEHRFILQFVMQWIDQTYKSSLLHFISSRDADVDWCNVSIGQTLKERCQMRLWSICVCHGKNGSF